MPCSSKANAADYTLKQLDDADHIKFTRLQNAHSWKGRLSHENYMLRETTLSKSKIAASQHNYLAVFALHSNANPSRYVASCELLVRESWRFDFNTQSNASVRKKINSGCIGGVYTYPEYRGKGLATIMIDKLVAMAQTNLVGPDGFLFLYSEVGEYYSRNGFHSFEVPLTNIPLTEQKDPVFLKQVESLPFAVELVDYHDFEPLFQAYNKYELNRLLTKTTADHKSRVSINPTADYVDWFHLRSKYLSHQLFYESNPPLDYERASYDAIIDTYKQLAPHKFGIKLSDPSTNRLIGFIAWTYEWTFNDEQNKEEDYVTIIKTFVDEDHYDYNKFSLLLIELCKNYLQQHDLFSGSPIPANNLLKLVLWESDTNAQVLSELQQKYNSKSGLANGSRSAIMIHDPKEHTSLLSGDLIWELNNKIPWF